MRRGRDGDARTEAGGAAGWRPALTDAQLVERALQGSDEAFAALVGRYQRSVFNLLARMLNDPALAEDMAQETFLKAFSRLATFDPQFKFQSWLLRIAHNTAIDAMRRRGPRQVSLDEPDLPERARLDQALVDPGSDAAPREAERHDLGRMLRAAMGGLRPEYRRILVLRYQEELSYEEICEVTGLPLGTIKSHLHRAREEMARCLERDGWR